MGEAQPGMENHHVWQINEQNMARVIHATSQGAHEIWEVYPMASTRLWYSHIFSHGGWTSSYYSRSFTRGPRFWLFCRGQPNSWPLNPEIFRSNCSPFCDIVELSQWKRCFFFEKLAGSATGHVVLCEFLQKACSQNHQRPDLIFWTPTPCWYFEQNAGNRSCTFSTTGKPLETRSRHRLGPALDDGPAIAWRIDPAPFPPWPVANFCILHWSHFRVPRT